MDGKRLRVGPLERRLLIVAVLALLPVALLSLASLVANANHQRARFERTAIDTLRALTSAVDSELNLSVAALQVLSQSSELAADDLQGFHRMSRGMLSHRTTWDTLILADAAGRQLLNLQRAFGAALPEVSDPDTLMTVVRTAQPMIGHVAPSRTTQRMRFSVRVPVVRDGVVAYVLAASVRPEGILPVLLRQQMPPESVVSILDARGSIVARSRSHAEVVGKSAPATLSRLMEGKSEGWGPTLGLEGQELYSAFTRSAWSGWSLALGIPREVIDAPIRSAYITFGAGMLLSLALGLGASLLASRAITRPMHALREAARAVGLGKRPTIPRTNIPEVQEVVYSLVVAQTEREKLLRREREARAMAEDASRAKDEFLAMLGHELRNPLAAIANATKVIGDKNRTPHQLERASAIIDRQTEHLKGIIDDLLDVGRVMTGKILLHRQGVNAAETVRHVVAALSTAGRLKHHRITLSVADVWIHGDRTRLEQIVSNLVINAVTYTTAGGEVQVYLFRDGPSAVLRIRDTGIGISPENLPRIFDLFFQAAQDASRPHSGLGVGLTLVRRLVELHGGSIEAASEGLGRGTTFTVLLPAMEAPAASESASHADAGPARRVLVVEDNPDARESLKMALQLAGHEVSEAGEAASALAQLTVCPPEVAVIDIGLPEMDGYQLAQAIRARYRDSIYLVALTGYGAETDKQRARHAGFDAHLTKPVNFAELDTLVRSATALGAARASTAS